MAKAVTKYNLAHGVGSFLIMLYLSRITGGWGVEAEVNPAKNNLDMFHGDGDINEYKCMYNGK